MQKILSVRADWDSEAKVWVATSEDIPGLATEAETVEALLAKLETMVPEMLAENGISTDDEVPWELHSTVRSIARRAAS